MIIWVHKILYFFEDGFSVFDCVIKIKNNNNNKNTDSQSMTNDQEIHHDISVQHEDADDKNLSWLLNFKLDELPHLSPEAKRKAMNSSNIGQNAQDKPCFEEDDTNVAENIVIENNTTKA